MTTGDFLDGLLMATGFIFWVTMLFIAILWGSYKLIPPPSGHHPDTLRIRCEDEQGGVLIGQVCIKKEAILWSEKDAPR